MTRPRQRAWTAAVVALPDGEDTLWEWVEEGHTMRTIMAMVAAETGCHERPSMFYSWVHSGGPEREARFELARERSSHAMVDDAVDLVDNADPITIAMAREQARIRQWVATKRNRKVYGEDKGPGVTINVASLHLDALRKIEAESSQAALPPEDAELSLGPAPDQGIEDAEVLAVEDEG